MRVKFYPENTLNAEICKHKNNADCTFSETTDVRYLQSSDPMEMWGFKNNIRLSTYINQLYGDNENITDVLNTGVIDFDIYFNTDKWKNPITGVIENIPDYYSLSYSQSGVDAYGVTLNQSKSISYPNHGQEMFNVSGGALGYDYENSVSGASNQYELIGVIESQKEWYNLNLNKLSSSISYRGGKSQSSKSLIPYLLGGRNSNVVGGTSLPANVNTQLDTFYGVGLGYDPNGFTSVNRADMLNYENSLRYYDYTVSRNLTDANTIMNRELQATILNNGWFRNFTHWHDANSELTVLRDYLELCKTNFTSNNVHTCSAGEAIEYLFLREITNRVTAQEKNSKVYIIADVIDKYKNLDSNGISEIVPYDVINTSLSVKLDLTGTSLAGQNIKSSFGKIIDLGSNEIIVEIPFNKKELFQTITLEVGADGYYNTNIPTATFTNISNLITITSNQKVKAVLFSKLTAETEVDYIVVQRSNDLKEIHTFVSESGKNYRFGIINEFGKMNLIDI